MSILKFVKLKFIMLNNNQKNSVINAICLPNNFFDNYIVINDFDTPNHNNLISYESIKLTTRKNILLDNHMIIDDLKIPGYDNLMSFESIKPIISENISLNDDSLVINNFKKLKHNNLVPFKNTKPITRNKILLYDDCMIIDKFKTFEHDNLVPYKSTKPITNKKISPNGECCFSCNTKYSILWRSQKINGDVVYLCNACGLKYKKGQYCPVCHMTYYQYNMNDFHGKICIICNKWVHNDCLVMNQICKKCTENS